MQSRTAYHNIIYLSANFYPRKTLSAGRSELPRDGHEVPGVLSDAHQVSLEKPPADKIRWVWSTIQICAVHMFMSSYKYINYCIVLVLISVNHYC